MKARERRNRHARMSDSYLTLQMFSFVQGDASALARDVIYFKV
jgi:hypothetical protein